MVGVCVNKAPHLDVEVHLEVFAYFLRSRVGVSSTSVWRSLNCVLLHSLWFLFSTISLEISDSRNRCYIRCYVLTASLVRGTSYRHMKRSTPPPSLCGMVLWLRLREGTAVQLSPQPASQLVSKQGNICRGWTGKGQHVSTLVSEDHGSVSSMFTLHDHCTDHVSRIARSGRPLGTRQFNCTPIGTFNMADMVLTYRWVRSLRSLTLLHYSYNTSTLLFGGAYIGNFRTPFHQVHGIVLVDMVLLVTTFRDRIQTVEFKPFIYIIYSASTLYRAKQPKMDLGTCHYGWLGWVNINHLKIHLKSHTPSCVLYLMMSVIPVLDIVKYIRNWLCLQFFLFSF